MVRLRMTIPRYRNNAGFLSVEMNVHDEDEATTIANALCYICEADVGLETDTGVFAQIKYLDLTHKRRALTEKADEKPPWE